MGFKSSSQQMISSSDIASEHTRKRSSKELKSFSSDQDYGICLLKDSPYRILRVILKCINFIKSLGLMLSLDTKKGKILTTNLIFHIA